MLKTRIYSYAPDHWGRYQRVMIGVLAAGGRPFDRHTPFGLGNEVWIESQPWPYVQAPEDEEARAMAVAVQLKSKVDKALIDFHCTDPDQEALVLATVRRPDLKHLHFARHCTFSDEFFQQLGAEVTNLESLELVQRYIAAPYCSEDACDIGVSRMVRNSSHTLQKLSIKMARTERTLQAIRTCTNLKELELNRSDMELIDLRFVSVERLTLNMCEPMFWDVFFEQTPASLREIYLENVHYSRDVRKATELLHALSKAVHKLEHFYLGFISFPHDDFWRILSTDIQSSTTLTSFGITRYGSVSRELPGFRRTEEYGCYPDCILYTRI